jgi:hypothetical protein
MVSATPCLSGSYENESRYAKRSATWHTVPSKILTDEPWRNAMPLFHRRAPQLN